MEHSKDEERFTYALNTENKVAFISGHFQPFQNMIE